MKRHTKIVCTLGPAVDSPAALQSLVKEGMTIARLNCSHGDWEAKKRWIEWLRSGAKDQNPVGILADLQGPKFRVGTLPVDPIDLQPGQSVRVGPPDADIPIPSRDLMDAMQRGDRVLLGDGNIEIRLGNEIEGGFEAKVVSGGLFKSRQGVTVMNRAFSVPCLTSKDLADIHAAVEAGVDFIALSYVRSGADMRELRQIVDKLDPSIQLVAKIETREALKDLENVLKFSDAVMVARGDLGLQMDIEDVPVAQKRIIRMANLAGVPVITATQMLESMIVNARPTRAEATDIANAILDGTDAVMLSGETATGAYPIEAVRIMARISEEAEPLFGLHEDVRIGSRSATRDVVALAAVEIAAGLKAKAILTISTTGFTPRMVAKYRPRQPILCATWNPKVQNQLAMVHGVHTTLIDVPMSLENAIEMATNSLLRMKALKAGDLIVLAAGYPLGKPGQTNMVQVLTI